MTETKGKGRSPFGMGSLLAANNSSTVVMSGKVLARLRDSRQERSVNVIVVPNLPLWRPSHDSPCDIDAYMDKNVLPASNTELKQDLSLKGSLQQIDIFSVAWPGTLSTGFDHRLLIGRIN